MDEDKPNCYKEFKWERENVRCKGGPDPAYVDNLGGHIRPTCDYYQMCAARKMAQQNAMAGLSNQTRALPVATQPPQPSTQAMQLQAQQQAMQLRTPSNIPTLPATTSTMMGMPMQFTPVSFMGMNSYIPAYLSVPEPVVEGDSMASYVGRSIARSMLKSAGHTLAHIFDTIPFRKT